MKKATTEKIETKQLRQLNAGDCFRLTKYAKTVYVMGVLKNWKYEKQFDVANKTFATTNFGNFSIGRNLAPEREVVVGFTF